jgi:hypothetical protein
MNVDVLLGLQWGDEGKGKIVDVLTQQYDVVARFQGGPNAGHTLEFNGIKHVLHTIPSGIFHEGVENLIGNGVVIDPLVFALELDKLAPIKTALLYPRARDFSDQPVKPNPRSEPMVNSKKWKSSASKSYCPLGKKKPF